MVVRSQANWALAAAVWLLVAAWLCASVRSVGIEATLNWFAEGPRFSHQQRLAIQVAEVLGEKKETQRVQAEPDSAPQPPAKAPSVPTGPSKKLEVPLARAVSFESPTYIQQVYSQNLMSPKGRGRPAPPHAPPRSTRIV